MPNNAYRALTEDAPAKSSVVSAPSTAGAHSSRLREIAVRMPRGHVFRRRASHNNRKAPTVEGEDCHSSSSTPSPPPKRDGAGSRELFFDIESSPPDTPQGSLVFIDSSPEREETHQKTLIVPSEDVLLPCPLSPDVTSLFESNAKCSGSPPCSPAGCLNVTASSGPICRICHEGDQTESLMSLCKCSGTMGLLHVSCLEHWLNAQNVDHCEICHHRFPTATQATCMLRFFHWALHGDSQRALLGDLFCFALLTPVAALSCFLCAHSASKQAREGRLIEAASLVTLAGLLITAYLAWSFFTVRFHFRTFALWQARNPMRGILAQRPFSSGQGRLRRPEGQPAGPREMVDVVAGSINETDDTTQREGRGGLREPLEPTQNSASPEDTPSAAQSSVYAPGSFAGFAFW